MKRNSRNLWLIAVANIKQNVIMCVNILIHSKAVQPLMDFAKYNTQVICHLPTRKANRFPAVSHKMEPIVTEFDMALKQKCILICML